MIRYTKLITVLLLMMTTPALGVDWLVLPERSNDVTVRAKTVAEKSAANASQLIIRTAGSDPHVIGRLATPLAKQDSSALLEIISFKFCSSTIFLRRESMHFQSFLDRLSSKLTALTCHRC